MTSIIRRAWRGGPSVALDLGTAWSRAQVCGDPIVTDGPWVETKEHFAGFSVVDVPDRETAKLWAGKIAVGCGWPMQVQQLGTPPDIS